MKVLKFGGSSVANPQRIQACGEVLLRKQKADPSERHLVVCSALGGATDALDFMGRKAQSGDSGYRDLARDFRDRHMQCALDLLKKPTYDSIEPELKERLGHLDDLLYGVYLLRELSTRTFDELIGLGELLSLPILWGHFKDLELAPHRLDSRDIFCTDDRFGSARVDKSATSKRFDSADIKGHDLLIMEGFIGSTSEGVPTTLGRGGSDLSAALAACFVGASAMEKWTDVRGMMTCDPSVVPSARVMPTLSYAEGMELCHFGAKVVYPPTIAQLKEFSIPLHIFKTDDPSADGTCIGSSEDAPLSKANRGVRGLSSMKGVSLITVSGGGMIGAPDFSRRLFTALSIAGVQTLLMTQGSSEPAVTIGVFDRDSNAAQAALEMEFGSDQQLGLIDELKVETGHAVVALVGDGMRARTNVSGRAFATLGRNGVSVRAIAQGSTERNISIVLPEKHVRKALQALHAAFFEREIKRIHIFCLGVGNVGGTMVDQILAQQKEMLEKHGIDLALIGMANSSKMRFDISGISEDRWLDQLKTDGEASSPEGFVQRAIDMDLENSVLVDNTASKEASDVYEVALSHSIAVVASNKIATSDAMPRYLNLKDLALEHGVEFRFETNVGAGLPLIDTIQHLVQSGDQIHKMEAMLSGTLNYVFSNFDTSSTFHDIIVKARKAGLTEPDPRTDLSGIDVQRKILILAREAGNSLEIDDVDASGFLKPEMMKGSIDEFMASLPSIESAMQKRVAEAVAVGGRLKYVATWDSSRKGKKAQTGLQVVGPEHPFYSIEGVQNIVLIHSDRYNESPMIVQGAGAGAAVTAMGVFADLIRIAASR
ncbi:MAG: bifunctional aspartate kinase/homoserine dehydrogenase I [Flavobacteriales bacterium]|nr:bifunctional aspartate kinase/homoserine dehydrogenase I [Flavobacteriales bacterium]